MPDGDKIHPTLRSYYRSPYRQLCEGKATDVDCSVALQDAMKRDLQRAGDVAAAAALAAGDTVARVLSSSGGFDPARANEAVDAELRGVRCPSRYKEQIRSAARDLVQDLRYGHAGGVEDAGAEVFRRFALGRVESQFTARVPQAEVHHNGANPAELAVKIESVMPGVERAAAQFARQVRNTGRVDSLRRPPKPRSRPVSLNENLL